MDERETILAKIKELKKIADKKHSLTNSSAQKLDFFLAGLQLKALLKHEHQFDDEELLAYLEEFSRVETDKIKMNTDKMK